MHKLFKIALLAILTLSAPIATHAQNPSCKSVEPVNSINEMFSALNACWVPPEGTKGMSITLRFSLRRDGTLIGNPRTTYTNGIKDDERSREFTKVLPINFTASMGGAIAGRPIALRFIAP